MTTVAGLVFNGEAWLGSDSATAFGWQQRMKVEPKVLQHFVQGGSRLLIGSAGRAAITTSITYHFKPPIQTIQTDEEYIATLLMVALREAIAATQAYQDNERNMDGDCLVGYRGKLYRIGCDFIASQMEDGFDAIGSGSDFAIGALAILRQNKKLTPQQILTQALEVSKRFDMGTAGDIRIFPYSS